MASLNRVDIIEGAAQAYLAGESLTMVSRRFGMALSTLRARLNELGMLRSPDEARQIARSSGRYGTGPRPGRVVSDATKAKIRRARREWADKNAAGVSMKASGYVEITRGEHKGRSEHVRVMEERIGRRLLADEVVHHIDRNRRNNSIDNLALVTRAGHTRLHRFEDKLEGKERNRDNGRFA